MTGSTSPGLSELVDVEPGSFAMGSVDFYPDEAPVTEVSVEAFRIERHPVTNEQFGRFVEDTGYVTVAERPLDPADFPGADPEVLLPGGLVFAPTPEPVPLNDWTAWWHWRPGARWCEPGGPGTGLAGREHHPVVLVAYEDALAYARWAGRDLPTEAEFEFAARGGSEGTVYAWGNEPRPGGRLMANTWQGRFPYLNAGADGWVGTSPVGTFPENGYGLVDMIGNVWEWTSTYYVAGRDRFTAAGTGAVTSPGDAHTAHACCAPSAAAVRPGLTQDELAARSIAPGETQPRRALKGGSHLCAPEYCLRYRPAARSPQSVDSATTHIGFRCVVR